MFTPVMSLLPTCVEEEEEEKGEPGGGWEGEHGD